MLDFSLGCWKRYSMIPAATPTFSDSIAPAIGSASSRLQRCSASRETPWPSLPNTSATLCGGRSEHQTQTQMHYSLTHSLTHSLRAAERRQARVSPPPRSPRSIADTRSGSSAASAATVAYISNARAASTSKTTSVRACFKPPGRPTNQEEQTHDQCPHPTSSPQPRPGQSAAETEHPATRAAPCH